MSQKTLLIIGNGFDLKCGLKSQYIDFWREQRNKHKSFNKFVSYLENNSVDSFNDENLDVIDSLIELEDGITFLDYYFTLLDWKRRRLNKSKAWSDIEDMLLYGFESSNVSQSFNFDSCCSCYYEIIEHNLYPLYKNSYPHLIACKYLGRVFGEKDINYNKFRSLVISELDSFSINFSKYINKQVKGNHVYYELAQKLIMNITNTALNECQIVSFNYTEPIASPNLANIHGLASKNKVVLGITCGSGKDKESTHHSWYYEATKEYKIANVLANGIKVSANYSDITDVYVYGLSLGKQDYDFFDNLFDEFDILMRRYSLKIHFCYSVYGGKSIDEVAQETTNRVTELINTYGDNHQTYGLLRSMIQKGHLFFDYIE